MGGTPTFTQSQQFYIYAHPLSMSIVLCFLQNILKFEKNWRRVGINRLNTPELNRLLTKYIKVWKFLETSGDKPVKYTRTKRAFEHKWGFEVRPEWSPPIPKIHSTNKVSVYIGRGGYYVDMTKLVGNTHPKKGWVQHVSHTPP